MEVLRSRRPALVAISVMMLLLASASLAAASIQSKTITTTAGGEAVYGLNGFTGTITYSADEIGTSAKLDDYLCTHKPGDAQFKSWAGTYTLTVKAGSTVGSGATLATSTYTVTGGVDCVDGANPVSGTVNTFLVPAGGVVNYSILISGITSANCPATFSAFNSIRNQAFDQFDGSHAASLSVAPCAPPPQVPEVPFAGLLVVTGAIGAALFVAYKQGLLFANRSSAA